MTLNDSFFLLRENIEKEREQMKNIEGIENIGKSLASVIAVGHGLAPPVFANLGAAS
jgi:hypothetical protein